jgi:hypothetical protein
MKGGASILPRLNRVSGLTETSIGGPKQTNCSRTIRSALDRRKFCGSLGSNQFYPCSFLSTVVFRLKSVIDRYLIQFELVTGHLYNHSIECECFIKLVMRVHIYFVSVPSMLHFYYKSTILDSHI